METNSQAVSNYPSFVTLLFKWWLLEMPKNIFRGTIQVAKNLFNFFSIILLVKTIFDPWKRDVIDTKNLSLGQQAQVLVMNLVSRFFGAIVRLFTILAGLVIIILEIIFGFLWMLIFVLSPFIAIGMIVLVTII